MEQRDWRERLVEVPAWVSVLAGYGALIGIGYAVGSGDEYFPASATLAAILLTTPAVVRASRVPRWRGPAFLLAFVWSVLMSYIVDSLALWLALGVIPLVFVAYLVVDRAYEGS